MKDFVSVAAAVSCAGTARWLAGVALSVAMSAMAQGYPNKPVKLIVPFPPGGGSDVVGRIMAQKLTERLGEQVVVDNRAGAGGSIGTGVAVRSPADGYTLVLASTSEIAINPKLYGKLNYDTVTELAPIAMVATMPMVVLVNPSVPVRSVQELIALDRAQPGAINVASAGSGTISHLSGELFRTMTGAKWVHIPYKGTAPALTDVVGGQVQVLFTSLPGAMGAIQSNLLRPLAVSVRSRVASLPDVPTVMESGVPEYNVEYWMGIFAPAATPREVLARLSEEITQMLRHPDLIGSLAKQGAVPGTLTQGPFAEFVKNEVKRWGEVVRTSGAKTE